jgi:hypothetical protein
MQQEPNTAAKRASTLLWTFTHVVDTLYMRRIFVLISQIVTTGSIWRSQAKPKKSSHFYGRK